MRDWCACDILFVDSFLSVSVEASSESLQKTDNLFVEFGQHLSSAKKKLNQVKRR